MNLMPPGGGKQPLHHHQMKVREGKLDNNGMAEQKAAHWIYTFTSCQLNVVFVVSYLFVSFLFPM